MLVESTRQVWKKVSKMLSKRNLNTHMHIKQMLDTESCFIPEIQRSLFAV